MECGLAQVNVIQVLAVALGGIIICIGDVLMCSASKFVVNHYVTSKGQVLFFSGIIVCILGLATMLIIGFELA